MKKFFAIVFAVILICWGLIMTLGYLYNRNEGLYANDETLILITVSIVGWLPLLLGFVLVYWLIRSRRANLDTNVRPQNFTLQNMPTATVNFAVNPEVQKKEINSQNYFE